MGNACASCAGGAQDAVADAQAAAANMQAQRDAAKQEALDKKIESSDAKVDKEVMKERGVLNATMTALTQVVIEYQRVLDGDPTLSVLSVPQLSVWAAKEDADGNSTFCGDKVAKENIHLAAARIAMIAEARAEFLGDPAKDNVETFNEAKTEIKDAIKAIELYIEAELELPAIQTALEAAKDKHKEQELEVKGADEDKKDAEEAKLEKLEEIKEKAQEKFDEATEKIKDTKKEALDLAKGGKAGTDLIKKACQVRCKGYEKIDISVRAAVRANPKTSAIKGFEPVDAADSLGALGADLLFKAGAAAGSLTGASNELSKATTAKMAEATRLLNHMVRSMEAWANEEAKQGIATAHGPKVEEDILGELAAVLDEESGARQAVKDLILTGRDKRITKCSTACEKFVDQAKSFIEGLTPVKERLTEFETAAADEEKQRKISSIGKVPALEEKVAAAKEKFEDKKKELKDKEKEIKANKDEDEEAKLEKEQEKLEKEMEKFEAEWEKLKEQLDELNDKVKEEAGDLADKEKDTQKAKKALEDILETLATSEKLKGPEGMMTMSAFTVACEEFSIAFMNFCCRQGELPPLAGSAAEKRWIESENKRIAAEIEKLQKASTAPPLELDVPAGEKAIEAAEKAGVGTWNGGEDGTTGEAIEAGKAELKTATRLVAAAKVEQAQKDVADSITAFEPMDMDTAKADKVLEKATIAPIPAAELAAAKDLVSKAKIAQASAKLTAALAPGALDMDVPAAEVAADEAEKAGVPADEVANGKKLAAEAKAAQKLRAECAAALAAAVAFAPLEMDVPAAEAAVTAAKDAFVAAAEVEKGAELVATAKDLQAKRDAAAAALAAATAPPSLELDWAVAEPAAEEALAAGVPAAEVDKAKAITAAAKKEQAEVKLAAAIAFEPLEMDLEAADAAVEFAIVALVAGETVDSAKGLVKAAKCAQAEKTLTEAMELGAFDMDVLKVEKALAVAKEYGVAAEHVEKATMFVAQRKMADSIASEPLEMDVPGAEEAIKVASGIPSLAEDVEKATPAVRAAKVAQAAKKLADSIAFEPLEMDVPVAEAALATASELSELNEEVAAATGVIVNAKDLQAKRDAAAEKLAKAVAPPPLEMDVPAAEVAAEEASAAGVPAEVVDKAKVETRAAKVAQASAKLTEATDPRPLEMDVPKAQAAMAVAAELEELTDEVGTARLVVREARVAQASANLAAAIAFEPLVMDVPKAEAVLEIAAELNELDAEVAAATPIVANAKDLQAQRDTANDVLAAAIAPPPLEVDVPAAEAAAEDALAKGVPAEVVEKAKELAAAALVAQTKRDEAQAALVAVVTPSVFEAFRAQESALNWLSKAETAADAANEAAVELAQVEKAEENEKQDVTGGLFGQVRKAFGFKHGRTSASVKMFKTVKETEAAHAAKVAEAAIKVSSVKAEAIFEMDVDTAQSLATAAAEAGVSQAEVEKAKLAAGKAKEAQIRREKAMKALLAALAPGSLDMDVPVVRAAAEEAFKAGASHADVVSARLAADVAEVAQAERDDAAAVLEAAIELGPLDMDVPHAEAAVADATLKGVPAGVVEKAAKLAAEAKAAQALRAECSAALAALIAPAPLDVDVPAAEAALKAAKDAFVDGEEVEAAAALVLGAKRVQAEPKLLAAIASEPLEMDVPMAKQFIVVAKEVGVAEEIIANAETAVKAAKEVQDIREGAAEYLQIVSKVPKRKMDIAAVEAAIEEAIAAHVQPATIEAAREKLEAGKDEAKFMAAQQMQAAARGYALRRERSGVGQQVKRMSVVKGPDVPDKIDAPKAGQIADSVKAQAESLRASKGDPVAKQEVVPRGKRGSVMQAKAAFEAKPAEEPTPEKVAPPKRPSAGDKSAVVSKFGSQKMLSALGLAPAAASADPPDLIKSDTAGATEITEAIGPNSPKPVAAPL